MPDAPVPDDPAGSRGPTVTDEFDTARRVAYRRALADTLRLVITLVADDESIVVGGTPTLATQPHRGFPPYLGERAIVVGGLHPGLPAAEIAERSVTAVQALRRMRARSSDA